MADRKRRLSDVICLDSDSDVEMMDAEPRRKAPKVQQSPASEVVCLDSDEDENKLNRKRRGQRDKVKAQKKRPVKFVSESYSSDDDDEVSFVPSKKKPRMSSSAADGDADLAYAMRLHEEEHRIAAAASSAPAGRSRSPSGNVPSRAASAAIARFDNHQARQLKSEQDREYEEALLADQIKDIERREAEEAARKENEAEQRMKEGQEDAEMMEKACLASTLADAKSLLSKAGEEPPTGVKGVTRLRLTLPNGKKLDRRFDSEDTLALVRAFLIVHFDEKRLDIKNFSLVGHYPKCEFREEQANLTLEEANLAPQAVLLVIDLDS